MEGNDSLTMVTWPCLGSAVRLDQDQLSEGMVRLEQDRLLGIVGLEQDWLLGKVGLEQDWLWGIVEPEQEWLWGIVRGFE